MNKKRRNEVKKIYDEIEELKDRISSLMEEEQEYFDCMPEGIQSGEKGDQAEQYIYAFEYAITGIEEAQEQLEELQN